MHRIEHLCKRMQSVVENGNFVLVGAQVNKQVIEEKN